MWNDVLKILLDNLSLFLQNVLVGVLPILAAAAAAFVIAKAKEAWAKSKLAGYVSPEQLKTIAVMAVQAAEQLGLNEEIDNKKDYAIQTAQNYISNLGLKVDLASIEAAVEAAVLSEFNKE